LQQVARERNVELGFELGDADEAGARTRAPGSEISFEDEMTAEVA